MCTVVRFFLCFYMLIMLNDRNGYARDLELIHQLVNHISNAPAEPCLISFIYSKII